MLQLDATRRCLGVCCNGMLSEGVQGNVACCNGMLLEGV